LWVSLLVLLLTAGLQAIVVVWSGSVALLGDTVHNAADALTAVPLGLAFLAGRRAPRRWSGSSGNELVARYRIMVGRRIGSAALMADGLHARTDGFTSLAVLVGAAGVAAGWRWADPVVGLGITVAILLVLRDAAREVYRRLMDAVDPALVAQAERSLAATDGVERVGRIRLRWIGHQLHAEAEIVLDPQLSLIAAHQIAIEAEHRLLHQVPRLRGALIHPDPRPTASHDPHAVTAHHHASS